MWFGQFNASFSLKNCNSPVFT